MKVYKIEGSTPTDMSEISEYINSLPAEQRASAEKVLRMTWDFLVEAAKAHNEFGGDSIEHLDYYDDYYDDRN